MERLLRSVCRPRRIRKSSFVSTTPLSRLPLSIHSSTNPERTPLRLFAIVEWFLTLLPRPFRAIISLGRGQLVVAIWPYYSPLRRRRRRNDLERKYCAEQALREKVKIQRSLHSVLSRIRPKCKGTERPTDGEEGISFADVPHSVSLFCIMKNLHQSGPRPEGGGIRGLLMAPPPTSQPTDHLPSMVVSSNQANALHSKLQPITSAAPLSTQNTPMYDQKSPPKGTIGRENHSDNEFSPLNCCPANSLPLTFDDLTYWDLGQ